MRTCVIWFLLALATLASAETIRLKNGKKIVADTVREHNGRVEYEIGDDVYAIPKTLVESIEAGGVPGKRPAQVPDFAPSEELSGFGDLPTPIVRDGRVDPEALAAVEKIGDPSVTALARFAAARHEYERGNRDGARFHMERALSAAPDNATVLTHYAAILVQLGRAPEAVGYAERATRLAPESADAHVALGFAYFASDKSRQAVVAWKRALQLHPNQAVEAMMAKAERELTAEASYSQRESGHFTLRYEGGGNFDGLGRAVLDTLESHYDELVRELGVTPRAGIAVILYTDQAFFDVTQAPSWIGAMNDGKLRLPVSGVTSMTPEQARVLKHELAHSFITEVSRGRCPQWLHEGVAQLLEPRNSRSLGRVLARVFADGRQVPLAVLEGSFIRLSGTQAQVAYAESLIAAEYIRDTYGMGDLQRVLVRIGDGSSTEAALRATIHSGYAQLEEEIARYLKERYGE